MNVNLRYATLANDGKIAIQCDRCYEVNDNLYFNVDIESIQFNADYAMHKVRCAFCLHDNFVLTFYR